MLCIVPFHGVNVCWVSLCSITFIITFILCDFLFSLALLLVLQIMQISFVIWSCFFHFVLAKNGDKAGATEDRESHSYTLHSHTRNQTERQELSKSNQSVTSRIWDFWLVAGPESPLTFAALDCERLCVKVELKLYFYTDSNLFSSTVKISMSFGTQHTLALV